MPGGGALPDWLVYAQPVLTATPTLASHIGVHMVELEQIRDSDKVKTVYSAAKITVGCKILTWTKPTMPTKTAATYKIFDPDMNIKIAPEFTQNPPCAYTADMKFKWTIPTGAPIYTTQDPYNLLVTSSNKNLEAIYTVFLDNTIVYDGVTWNERVSYDITVVNPCTSTALFSTNTTISNIEYNIGDSTLTQKFIGVSDTVTNAAATGDCGAFVYTLLSNDTQVGTPYIAVKDLLNGKGLQVYTESADNAGDFTITMSVYMKDNPTLIVTFTFDIKLKLATEAAPTAVSFAPILLTDVSETIFLTPGEKWELTLDAEDADDDLAEVLLTFSGSAKDWLDWDQKALTI